MESNRDESERCIDFAKQHEKAGDLQKALKFYVKSHKLYPNEEASRGMHRVEVKLKSGTSYTESNTTHRTEHEDQPQHHQQQQTSYTTEQLESVERIRKCADYYEILQVKREVKEVEIKKAYKRLALQMHPDKNGAPGAEEAFKKVSQAFSCLSDPSKRKMYDVRGTEEPTVAHSTRYAYEETELTPEEIFAAFFGHPMPSRGGVRFRTSSYPNSTYYYSTNSRHWNSGGPSRRSSTHSSNDHDDNSTGSFAFSFIQLLPLILLLLFTFLSSPSEPVFQLFNSREYSVRMDTKTLQIPYFVKPSFNKDDSQHVKEVESQVEETWVRLMRSECYNEQIQKKRAIYSAWTQKQKERAEATPTSSCDALLAKKLKIPSVSSTW